MIGKSNKGYQAELLATAALGLCNGHLVVCFDWAPNRSTHYVLLQGTVRWNKFSLIVICVSWSTEPLGKPKFRYGLSSFFKVPIQEITNINKAELAALFLERHFITYRNFFNDSHA